MVSDVTRVRTAGRDGTPVFAVSGPFGAVVLRTQWTTLPMPDADAEVDGRCLVGVVVEYHSRDNVRNVPAARSGCEYTGGECWGWSFFREAGELLRDWQSLGYDDGYVFTVLERGYHEQVARQHDW